MRLYQTRNYDFDRERVKGHYNDSKVLCCFDQRFILDCGNADDVTVYHDKEFVYVVSENQRIGYIGLQVFKRESGEQEFNIFFDSGNSDDTEWLLNISRYPTKIRFMCQWWV